jgi:hypothetical protein
MLQLATALEYYDHVKLLCLLLLLAKLHALLSRVIRYSINWCSDPEISTALCEVGARHFSSPDL